MEWLGIARSPGVTCAALGRDAAARRTSGLRIDLQFDFPIPATTLAEHATKLTIGSVAFHVASEADRLRLKKLALARRRAPGDVEDVAFLEARRSRR